MQLFHTKQRYSPAYDSIVSGNLGLSNNNKKTGRKNLFFFSFSFWYIVVGCYPHFYFSDFFNLSLLFWFTHSQDGKISQLEHVFIRGSKVRYVNNHIFNGSILLTYVLLPFQHTHTHTHTKATSRGIGETFYKSENMIKSLTGLW